MRGDTFSGGNVRVPKHLAPGDLDWEQSRPLKPWPIGPMPGQHYYWNWAELPLDLLELSTPNVIEILASDSVGKIKTAKTIKDQTAAIDALVPHLKNNPDLKRNEALELLKRSGLAVSGRGFQAEVWPRARKKTGLPALASAGAKRKS
jgi:hypothetical protein